MSQPCYKPKACAFHPKEMIFNFCKNQECLLPLCPTCVDLHTEEHKNQKTYGKFENMQQVVNDIVVNIENSVKQLESFKEEIHDQTKQKAMDQAVVKRKVGEAKQKVMGLVDRFFTDFQKELQKSILEFNVSMKENYNELNTQIESMKNQLNTKVDNLGTEKVLKTVIAYYSKEEEKKIENNLDVMRNTLQLCGSKRISLVSENSSIKKMVNQLSKYMYLSFENWSNDTSYQITDFVKTGFSHKTSGSAGSHKSRTSQVSNTSQQSRPCSITN